MGSFRFCRQCQFDYEEAGATPPPAPSQAATAPAAAVPATSSFSIPAAAVTIGGAAMVVGSLLPWITVTAFVTVSRSGLEAGDGLITIILGVAVVLIGLAALASGRAQFRLLAIALGALGLGITAIDYASVQDRIRTLDADIRDLASVGIGLYLVGVGALIALAGGLKMRPRAGVG